MLDVGGACASCCVFRMSLVLSLFNMALTICSTISIYLIFYLLFLLSSDTTKEQITSAGETIGQAHASLSLTADVQCTMMEALVNQMKDSCNFKYSGEKDAYVQVAAAYMTGFNEKAGDGEKKDDFVAYCSLGSLWE